MAKHDDNTPRPAENVLPATPAGTSRRSLAGAFSAITTFACMPMLGATAASMAPIPAIAALDPTSDPDAGLIRLCQEYMAYDNEFVRVLSRGYDLIPGDPLADRIHDRCVAMVPTLHAMEAKIAEMPATTPKGILAKARAARHVLSADADGGDGPLDDDNEFVWSLLTDICGRAGA